MATSGSSDFSATLNQIIKNALLNVGGIGDDEEPTNAQYENASFSLNSIVKNLRGQNLMLWKLDWITITLTASSVVLGADGVDYECIRNHEASSENRPVSGAKQLSFWKPLTTNVGANWVSGTSYNSICNVNLDSNILCLSDFKSRQDQTTVPMTQLSRGDYAGLAQTTTIGKPLQWYFFKQFKTPNSIFFYPYPDSTEYVFEGYAYRYPEDFDQGNNTQDFLSEWILPLTDLLSVTLAPKYGVFGEKLESLKSLAAISMERAQSADHETGDFQIVPYLQGGSY